MLTAYFDASGSPVESEVLVVAGFIAEANRWIEFEKAWKRVLSSYGVKSLHMKDYTQSFREFAGWDRDEAKRQGFMYSLLRVIEHYYAHSFGCALYRGAYMEANRLYRLDETSTPYGFAGCVCIAKVKEWATTNKQEFRDILFLFEDGDLGKGNLAKRAGEAFGVNPIFRPKTDSCVFEAADLLAYEQFKAHKLRFSAADLKLDWKMARHPFKTLFEFRGGKEWVFADTQKLLNNCAATGIPERSS